MTRSSPPWRARRHASLALAVSVACMALVPARATGAEPLWLHLDVDLPALATGATGAGADSNANANANPNATAAPDLTPPSLDFDLLGAPAAPPPAADLGSLRLRRTMLNVHQGIGFGLVALQLATTVVGQLNYSDRFAGGPSTGRYQLTHGALAVATLGAFAVNGTLALLAPSPQKRTWALDRAMVHRIAMFAAAAGMVTEGVLGVYTKGREGYLDQERFATAHLAIGYATLAAVLTGFGAMVW